LKHRGWESYFSDDYVLKEGSIMKLAITQIILGVIVLLIDGLIIGAALSTHFSYSLPDGRIVAQVFPETVPVTRGAAIAVAPFALAVVACGIVQLIKARRQRKN
jgi:hypothetical protein